jgi:hypothetical protein
MRDRHASGTEKWHRNKKLSEALELSWASLCFAAGHHRSRSGEGLVLAISMLSLVYHSRES